MAKTSRKVVARRKRIRRIRKKIFGTTNCPRMRVFRSNRHIYVQIIDDSKHATLVSSSTEEKECDLTGCKSKVEQAEKVGELIAQRAKDTGISQVVFDRGGYIYHGRIKALSDGARKAGLKF